MKRNIILWILTFVLLSSFASAEVFVNQQFENTADCDNTYWTPIGANSGTALRDTVIYYNGSASCGFSVDATSNSKYHDMDFDGTQDGINISFWVRRSGASNQDIRLTSDAGVGYTNFLLLGHAGGGTFTYNVGAGNVDSGVTFNTNTWYHNSLVRNGNNIEIYINGDFVVSTARTGIDMSFFHLLYKTDSNIDNLIIYNGSITPPPPPGANITVTMRDLYDSSAINNATINIDYLGDSYIFTNTTGNVIQTNITINETTLMNITATHPEYFTNVTLNQNISNNFFMTMYQSNISFDAFDLFGNAVDGNVTIGGDTNDLNYVWRLKADTYNAVFTGGEYFQKSLSITISPLDIATYNITGIYDTNFTVEAIDFITNGTINTFNVSIEQNGESFSIFNSTITGLLWFGLLKNYLYDIVVQSPSYLVGNNTNYNITTNLTQVLHSSTSVATFLDGNTTNPIVGKGITITYPGGFQLPLTTNANGVVEWVTIINGIELYGIYNITLDSTTGYDSPQSFLENITVDNAPLNETYIIQPAQLNITIRDQTTSDIITQSVIVTIVGIGQYNVTGGNLVIQDGSILPGSYTLYAVSDGYAIGQTTFEYNAQEVENINIFLINSSSPSTGTLSVIVYDEGYNTQLGADTRLLQYFAEVDSFVQVAQCFTNSNGECIFRVDVGTTLYKVSATKLEDDQLQQGTSSPTGEIFYIDEYQIEVHMFPSDLFESPDLVGFFIDPKNVSLIGNTSYLTGEFYDVNNVIHEVCIGYYRQDLSQQTLVAGNCINASSGDINVFGGYLLNRSNTYIAKFYVQQGDFENVQFEVTYSSETSFAKNFSLFGKYIILGGLLILLSASIYMKNIYIFAMGSIPFLIIFISLLPTLLNWSILAIYLFLDLCLMYLARKREGNLSV